MEPVLPTEPPEKSGFAPEKIIVDVPALNVNPVLKAKLNAVPLVAIEIMLLPKLIVRVLKLEELKIAAPVSVTSLLAVVNVPCVTVKVPEAVNGSPSVTVMPEPFTVTAPRVLPALVSVPVPANVSVPVYVYVMPATSVTLPDTVMAAVPANVPVNPVQVMDCAPVFPVEMVQVPVDRFVKNTASADVGTLAPPAPPDVVAHLVPAVPSQFAVPPTQYLSAMFTPSRSERR